MADFNLPCLITGRHFQVKMDLKVPTFSLQHLANPLPSRCRRPCRRTELFSTTVLYPLEVTKTKVPRADDLSPWPAGLPFESARVGAPTERGHFISR